MAAVTENWKIRCKPWLNNEGALYQRTDVAPPPSKDFLQLFITDSDIIFRIWKILPPTRSDSVQPPQEMRCKYDEFIEDDRMRAEISRTLGEREVEYVDNLTHGHIDYLVRLPRKILLRIIFQLDLVSISKLGQVNKLFREICSCDALWSKIYMEHTTQPITNDLLMLTDQKGWKEVFFMNKLQLQMHIRRQMDKPTKRFRFGDKFNKDTQTKDPNAS